jgi:transposase
VPDDLGDEGLFPVDPAQRVESHSVTPKAPVDKTFRVFAPEQGLLLPPSLDDWLPADHMVRFIADVVDEHLDLSRIHGAYTESRGGPPYDPRLMVRILLYGYTTGVRSSRAIARFRKRHLSALGHLFVAALALCQGAAGMVSLGRVALDGTKVRASASKRKAMSYARMTEKEKILAGEVSALLAEAERIDKAEDAQFGKNRRGDELLETIRAAKAALEAEAAEAAREQAERRSRERGDDDDTTAAKGEAAAQAAAPKPKAQRNFTDPDSKIMLTGDGAFHQCYNAQAVVDADHQVIVATEVNTNAADVNTLTPMTEQTVANTGAAPAQLLADAGYSSTANLDWATEFTTTCGTEFFIAPGRHRRDDPPPAAPRGRIPTDATAKQRMTRKLTTRRGRSTYARRKTIVEPVFGQMATLQNAKHLLLRGLDQARGEWLLLAACHNLRKLHGHIGITGLAALPAG